MVRMMTNLIKAMSMLGLAGSLMASTALAQEAEGPSSVQETYRDWIVSCNTLSGTDAQQSRRVCEMRQELRQTENNQLVLAIGLRTQAEGAGATLSLITPFGLALTENILINVTEAPLAEVPFQTCFPRGCFAEAVIEETELAALMAGDTAEVSMPTTSGQALMVSVSLTGFTAAWNRLQNLTDR